MEVVDNFGCNHTDYDGVDFEGKAALIPRGGCNYNVKALAVEAAGAMAALIYNDEMRSDVINGRVRIRLRPSNARASELELTNRSLA